MDKIRKRLMGVHSSMIHRCKNPKRDSYERYGAKGIDVCDEWKGENGFQNFYNWSMNNGYKVIEKENHRNEIQIDRIDGTKGYSPENCRWVTYDIQCKNRKSTHFETLNGVTKTVTEWEDEKGFRHGTIQGRLRSGWTIEEAITLPTDGKVKHKKPQKNSIKVRNIKTGDVYESIGECARSIGVKYNTVQGFLKRSNHINRNGQVSKLVGLVEKIN